MRRRVSPRRYEKELKKLRKRIKELEEELEALRAALAEAEQQNALLRAELNAQSGPGPARAGR